MNNILEELSYFDSKFVLALFLILMLSACLTALYKSFAIKKEIISNPNNRSLHKHFKPSGGGIVFSLICVFFVSILGFYEVIDFEMLMVFGLGAFSASLFGFIDDIYDIKPLTKLIIQISDLKSVLIDLTSNPSYEIVSNLNTDTIERFVKISLDKRLLLRILKGPRFAHWNNAEIGSHLKFERKPNIFERGLYHSLCFFHS